jgi:hypothetical protein
LEKDSLVLGVRAADISFPRSALLFKSNTGLEAVGPGYLQPLKLLLISKHAPIVFFWLMGQALQMAIPFAQIGSIWLICGFEGRRARINIGPKSELN